MLDQVLAFFDILPDFDLNIMKANQNLFDITTLALNRIREVVLSYLPDWLFVQGTRPRRSQAHSLHSTKK